MRRLVVLFALALLAGGCSDPIEQRSGEEVGAQLQRGVTGQGTLGPENRPANDPAAEHGVPQTHP
ncbi:MAG: hypothetical protein DLM52_04360 [Chthoniobacterales bacterium]|nr:MAG: hypothetical protein DLM52_04360 [Chthoniobacterales bacterium]